jgi:predicted GNAT superfamily acetyltransferase
MRRQVSSGLAGGAPSDPPLAPISPAEEAAVVALNNANATELSWLEGERLATLLDQAFHARRIGAVSAFLLAFDQHAEYDSPNFLWFRERYPRFVYIDRVAVEAAARGRGHARRLYVDLIRHASAAGHDLIACEVNIDPPNPASDAFHAALGFTQVGIAPIPSGKTVRYLARPVA